MGKKFLIDTNILVYLSRDSFPGDIDKTCLDKIFAESFRISVITQIEFLGWRKHTEKSFATAKKMLAKAKIYSLDTNIVEQTVRIRRQYRIKLPDAVIAASCLVYDLTLVTLNDKDFEGIDGLNMYNPLLVSADMPDAKNVLAEADSAVIKNSVII